MKRRTRKAEAAEMYWPTSMVDLKWTPDGIGTWKPSGVATKMKRKPGRPVSTGSKSTPLIQYRVSADQYAELKTEGRAAKPRLTPNQVAKRRAFPPKETS